MILGKLRGEDMERIVCTSSHCDKYDYALAAFSGVLTGLLDAFFVGAPGDSLLGNYVDSLVDKKIVQFARMVFDIDRHTGKNTQRKAPDTVSSAIGYLERRFKVNYDARFASDLIGGGRLHGMTPTNHHLRSLAHSPDIVGLFFSLLDQFTNRTTIVDEGRLIRLEPADGSYVLYGSNVVTKVACGVINWLGHIMSDVGGSSGTRGHSGKRGMGIPIPGFELFQFARLNKNEEIKGLATLTEQMFAKGYDLRFGVTMAIPVAINDILVRLFWTVRERYQYHSDWKKILRMNSDKRFIRMSLVSAGCFSIVDVGDAAIRSEGNLLAFALRVNYAGLCKLAMAGYREMEAKLFY